MVIKDYAVAARKTAIYPNRGRNLPYATLGLVEESEELVEKLEAADSAAALLEMVDIWWYVCATCDEAGLDISLIQGAASQAILAKEGASTAISKLRKSTHTLTSKSLAKQVA